MSVWELRCFFKTVKNLDSVAERNLKRVKFYVYFTHKYVFQGLRSTGAMHAWIGLETSDSFTNYRL